MKENYPDMQAMFMAFKQQCKQVEMELLTISEEKLNYKSHPQSWSALECIEHLNRYSKYYNKEIQTALVELASTSKVTVPKLSWFAKMSVKMVDPENQKKVKTIKRMNPAGSSKLDKSSLRNFLVYQEDLSGLVKRAEQINYNKKRVRVEFMKFMKLNIYESLLFMLKHQQRHINQAIRAVHAMGELED